MEYCIDYSPSMTHQTDNPTIRTKLDAIGGHGLRAAEAIETALHSILDIEDGLRADQAAPADHWRRGSAPALSAAQRENLEAPVFQLASRADAVRDAIQTFITEVDTVR